MDIKKVKNAVKGYNNELKGFGDELSAIAYRSVDIEGEISKVQQGLELLAEMKKTFLGIFEAIGTPNAKDDLNRVNDNINEAREKLAALNAEKSSAELRTAQIQMSIKDVTTQRDIAEYILVTAEILKMRLAALGGEYQPELKNKVLIAEEHRGRILAGKLEKRGVV